MSKDVKRALIIQSLFLCLQLSAQTLSIRSPKPGSALDEKQQFKIDCQGETPVRVSFFLNGTQVAERFQPPFEFLISWNTSLTNEVRVIATYEAGETREIRVSYSPPQVDYTEETRVFQCFPFPQRPWDNQALTLISNGRTIQPQSVKRADPLPCEWLVVLDISGSMHFFLEEIGAPLRQLTQRRASLGDIVGTMVFDAAPRNLDLATFWRISDLSSLFRERSQSAIWDALAAASTLFHVSPRRMMLLISDGADDGSRHDADSVASLLRQSDIILVWYNPSPLPNRKLARLCNRSGGLVLKGDPEKAMAGLSLLLEHQIHVIAPEASYPIEMKWKQGKIQYPTWRQ